MRTELIDISVSRDIIHVCQFKASLANYLKDNKENNNSLIIKQSGKPAGVLISLLELAELRNTKLFINSILRGLKNSGEGELYSTSLLKQELKKTRAKKNM